VGVAVAEDDAEENEPGVLGGAPQVCQLGRESLRSGEPEPADEGVVEAPLAHDEAEDVEEEEERAEGGLSAVLER
jgi:hypothetical protein